MENPKIKLVQMFDPKTNEMYFVQISDDNHAEVLTDGQSLLVLNESQKKGESSSDYDAVHNLKQGDTHEHADDATVDSWNNEATLAFITEYESFQKRIDNGKMKQKDAFEKIAENLRKKSMQFTSKQCGIKLASLKKAYKKIKDHNRQSGNDRQTWAYYERLDSIFNKKPWINPVATISSEPMKDHEEKKPQPCGAEISKPNPKEGKKRKKSTDENSLVEVLADEFKRRREERQARDAAIMTKFNEVIDIIRENPKN